MSGSNGGTPSASNSDLLRRLGEEACRLACGVAGPLRRLVLRAEGAAVELEWDRDTAGAGGSPPPAPATAATGPFPGEQPPALVRSPMVGTFYHAPAPGEPPFVSIGGVVEPDTVVGIVEAMKLMNEIIAGQAGVVREVLAPDGRPVEFEQPLIVLDPLPDLA